MATVPAPVPRVCSTCDTVDPYCGFFGRAPYCKNCHRVRNARHGAMRIRERKANMIPYTMIVNVGTLVHSEYAQKYPYHLILAQLYEESFQYRVAVDNMRSSMGTRFILDNGAHEGIVPTTESIASYWRIVQAVEPSLVVLPDLIGRNSHLSRELSMRFADRVNERYTQIKCMFVPQGENQEQIVAEYRFAQRELPSRHFVVGCGQSYLTWETAALRDEAARLQMFDECLIPDSKARFHILGGRWTPFNVRTTVGLKHHFVGLDSIKPCTCALTGALYPRRPREPVDRLSTAVAEDDRLRTNVFQFCAHYGLANLGK